MIGAIVQAAGMLVQTGMKVAATEIAINEQWEQVNAQLEGRDYTTSNLPLILEGIGGGISQIASVAGNAVQRQQQLDQQAAQQQQFLQRTQVPNLQLTPPAMVRYNNAPTPQAAPPVPRISDQELLDAWQPPAPAVTPAPTPAPAQPQISSPPPAAPTIVPRYQEPDDSNLVSLPSTSTSSEPWSSPNYSIDPSSLNYQD
jgi:hypothetical protein